MPKDVPDSDQLKKVVVAFRKVPPEVVCLQAKLTYYNANQNLLTRWFSMEYSMWFDLFLPGLDASNAPVPLGGTSNHFRAARLQEVGGVGSYTVTKDATWASGLPARDGAPPCSTAIPVKRLPARSSTDPPALTMGQGLHPDLPRTHAASLAALA